MVAARNVEHLQVRRLNTAGGKDVIDLYPEPSRQIRRPGRHQTSTSLRSSVHTAGRGRTQQVLVKCGVEVTDQDVWAPTGSAPSLQGPCICQPAPHLSRQRRCGVNGHNVSSTEHAAEQLDPLELGPGVEWFNGYFANAGSSEDEDSVDVLAAQYSGSPRAVAQASNDWQQHLPVMLTGIR